MLAAARMQLLTIFVASVLGCGSGGAYPDTPPVSPLGRSVSCDACGKPIASVAPEHLFEFQGIQYHVCNAACADQLKDDVIHERVGAHRHAH